MYTVLQRELESFQLNQMTALPLPRLSIRTAVEDIREVNKKVNELASTLTQMGQLQRLLRCTVCRQPVTHSVVAMTCCENVFGCVACAKRFFESATVWKCPICQMDLDLPLDLVTC